MGVKRMKCRTPNIEFPATDKTLISQHWTPGSCVRISQVDWSVVDIAKGHFMITRFLNKNVASLFRATLVGSGILCFLVPTVGFYKVAGLGLGGAQSRLGFGVVFGLNRQTRILFVVIALAEKIFVSRPDIEA